jgi:hypothetical protein
MLRKRNILICLTAVSLCLTGIALGKAVKQELVNENDEVIGNAILNYAKGADKTEIQVNCHGLEPETEYLIVLYQIDEQGNIADPMVIGSFITNKKGKGQLHARVQGDASERSVMLGAVGPDGLVTPCAGDGCVDPDVWRKLPPIMGDSGWPICPAPPAPKK